MEYEGTVGLGLGVSDGTQWPHWSEQIRGERPGGDPRRLEIWGYAGKPSYAPGETLTLHVTTTARNFGVRIFRDGHAPELVYQVKDLSGASHPTPDDAFAVGCRWPSGVTLEIPKSWRPGAYVVEFTARDERGSATQDGFFIVRPEQPGRDAPIAMVLATYSWQAYNDWGGGSYYSLDGAAEATEVASDEHGEVLRSGAGFSPRLSLQRPWARGLIRQPFGAPRMALRHRPPMGWAPRHEYSEWALANGFSHWSGCAGWAQFDSLFVRWAEKRGYQLELLTQWDLERDPSCLRDYACVVTVGHDEYWTAAGRRVLDSFIEHGGRYARFGGNILWQIRLDDDGTTQVCHKYVPETDPLASSPDRAVRTGAFESLSIGDPPVTTFGANGGRGCMSRFGGSAPRGIGGFVVYRNDHWVFEGTDLYYGDVLGADVPVVGYEADGVSYAFENGLPIPTGTDGTPAELEILALTPVTFNEEDHGNPGGIIFTGDGDVRFLAQALLGADTPETREQVRRGSAVITWMPKGAGEVVCCGCTEWPYALSRSEPMVERVAQNILDRFSTR